MGHLRGSLAGLQQMALESQHFSTGYTVGLAGDLETWGCSICPRKSPGVLYCEKGAGAPEER